MLRPVSLFENQRTTLEEAIEITAQSLRVYGETHKHWAIAYSGGKDSSAVATVIPYLIEQGRIPRPKSITVLYADTGMELPPLQISAMGILDALQQRGYTTRVVRPKMDDRFFVYMLGRGVPPPKNTFRWCTPRLKVVPMELSLLNTRIENAEKILSITGVRVGESAARDQRIAISCGRDGAECGQGWFQQTKSEAVADTLAPVLHWRVCHIWDWLTFHAPRLGFPTGAVAEAYGGDEAEERNARTGCVGCNLASKDLALENVLRLPHWSYLAPFRRLKPLYGELTLPKHRLRKDGSERRMDGTLASNPMRLGPLTMKARQLGLSAVLGMQNEINEAARALGRPKISLINQEEHVRILQLIEANTWPQGWSGDEVRGDVMLNQVISEGVVQPLLLALEDEH